MKCGVCGSEAKIEKFTNAIQYYCDKGDDPNRPIHWDYIEYISEKKLLKRRSDGGKRRR